MALFDENLAFLQRAFPDLAQRLQTSSPDTCRTEPAKNGQLTLTINLGGLDYALHSKFDPGAEAQKQVQSLDWSADHIVVLGLGLGYHLSEILARKNTETRVLVVESNSDILRSSMHTLDWSALLQRSDCHFLFGSDLASLSAIIAAFIDLVIFKQVAWLELAAETRLFADFFSLARRHIDQEIRSCLYDFSTLLKEKSLVPKNILRNLRAILHSCPVAALQDAFKGVPGFVVAAGPSLDGNILQLGRIRNRGIIIAVDTALKPLLKRGIQPHFTVVADPSAKNYAHMAGCERELEHFILAETGVAAPIFSDFSAPVFTVSTGKVLVSMLEKHSQAIGELPGWGSVVSLAAAFAVFCGCDPVVFAGQDFAYTNMRNHCRGTTWEDNWRHTVNSSDELQRRELQSITGNLKLIQVADIHKRPTYTSDRFVLYKNYLLGLLAKYPQRRFINATEGGILSEISCQPLQDVLEDWVFCRQEQVDLSAVRQIPALNTPVNSAGIRHFLQETLLFFNAYGQQVRKWLGQVELSAKLGLMDQNTLSAAGEELRRSLYAVPEHGQLLEMWSQQPIYTFLKKQREWLAAGATAGYQRASLDLYRHYFHALDPLLASINDSFSAALQDLSAVT